MELSHVTHETGKRQITFSYFVNLDSIPNLKPISGMNWFEFGLKT